MTDPELKQQMLQSILALSGSLSQTKHGQKVLTKLQKAYPHVFVGASAGAAPILPTAKQQGRQAVGPSNLGMGGPGQQQQPPCNPSG